MEPSPRSKPKGPQGIVSSLLVPHIDNAKTLLITRPHIEKAILNGLRKRILIIVAPPGYGKTTSLIQVFSALGRHVFWYTVDSGDVGPQKIVGSMRDHIQNVVKQDLPSLPSVAASALDHAEYFRRIIDRYLSDRVHVVIDSVDRSSHAETIGTFLQHFIDFNSPKVQLTIAATNSLNISLKNLARTEQLERIGKEELAFSRQETEELLSIHWGKRAAQIWAPELSRLSGGCVASIGLALIAWKDPPASQGDILPRLSKDSLEHSLNDVLEACDPEERRILFTMALLPEFNPTLLAKIVGHGCSECRITALLDRIPLASKKSTDHYSISPAIGDQIRSKIAAFWSDELILEAIRSGAREFETMRKYEIAVRLYLERGLIEEAGDAIEHMGIERIRCLEPAIATSWVTELHQSENIGPLGHLVCAKGKRFCGDFRASIPHYCSALDGASDWSLIDRIKILSMIYCLQRSLKDEESVQTRDLLFSLETNIDEERAVLLVTRGHILSAEGQLEAAKKALTEAVCLFRTFGDQPRLSDALSRLALLHLKLGNHITAGLMAKELTKLLPFMDSAMRFLYFQISESVHTLRGEHEAAEARLIDALSIARKADIHLGSFHILLGLSEISADKGDIVRAMQYLEEAEYRGSSLHAGPYIRACIEYHRGIISWDSEEHDKALFHLREFLSIGLHEPYYEACWKLRISWIFMRAGLIDEAQVLADAVVVLAEGMSANHLLANALLIRAYMNEQLHKMNESREDRHRCITLIMRGRYIHMPAGDQSLMDWINIDWNDLAGGRKGNILPRDRIVFAEDNTASLRIRTLGSFAIFLNDRELDPGIWYGRTKSKKLMQILLSQDSKTSSRDEIIEYLWPDAIPEKGIRGIHTASWALRKILKESGLADHIRIKSEFGFYRLVTSDSVFIDHVEFQSLISRAQMLIKTKREQEARRLLYKAEGLHRGGFMEDIPYERFADIPRTNIHDLQSDALKALATLSEDSSDAIVWWKKAIEHDQYDEEAYKGYIELSLALNMRREAHTALKQLEDYLVDGLGLPVPEWVEEVGSGV